MGLLLLGSGHGRDGRGAGGVEHGERCGRHLAWGDLDEDEDVAAGLDALGSRCEAPAAGLVVIADDEPLVRSGLRLILHTPIVEVVTEAVEGVEALDLARAHRPRIVLADLRMPRMNGIELTRHVRRDPNLDSFEWSF